MTTEDMLYSEFLARFPKSIRKEIVKQEALIRVALLTGYNEGMHYATTKIINRG